MEKPRFKKEQIVPATIATKKFADVRKKAKHSPQFISDHNEIDSVVLAYDDYEKMYMELLYLRQLNWERKIADRIKEAEANGTRYQLDEAMSKDEYENFQKLDPDLISDEDLFEK
ncbi:type II toxin-antitoxin system Phd/YefM family antitoxin [Halalkalibacter oceani]|uniref:Type II toxin-antitoxin system Phd/YefM family antitoxin n=1 Tax=Halalkalibacter oceani TaxID=1653776 RepID=A0A9X2DT61_9BACI|nr:type II toxin-antitoxin system Phd/YefM family antitoxin [Halalkalibacter oceani]MCM3716604.1 type II toxin-antitoxin system Phd/YefM family antitoxin [Halalkalibacter oceani]